MVLVSNLASAARALLASILTGAAAPPNRCGDTVALDYAGFGKTAGRICFDGNNQRFTVSLTDCQ